MVTDRQVKRMCKRSIVNERKRGARNWTWNDGIIKAKDEEESLTKDRSGKTG